MKRLVVLKFSRLWAVLGKDIALSFIWILLISMAKIIHMTLAKVN